MKCGIVLFVHCIGFMLFSTVSFNFTLSPPDDVDSKCLILVFIAASDKPPLIQNPCIQDIFLDFKLFILKLYKLYSNTSFGGHLLYNGQSAMYQVVFAFIPYLRNLSLA